MPAPSFLHLPAPCPESWDAMTPAGAGRHCAACRQVAVNFTQKTDAEILAYFRQATPGRTCGHFRASQVGRPLQPAAAVSRWRTWLGAVLAVGGALGAGRAAAQAPNATTAGPAPVAAHPARPAATPATPAASIPNASGQSLMVRGTVTDGATPQGLPGVTVLLQGTTLGVSTDVDGNFTLELPAGYEQGTLVFSSIGYETQRRPVAPPGEVLRVALRQQEQMLGGAIAVVRTRRPWPWHPRAFYYWGRYWLTRPFRP